MGGGGCRSYTVGMLKGPLLHPEILEALGSGGHGSRVLISDGNFPHATSAGANARVVFLNFAPGVLGVCDVLKVLTQVVPIEAAAVMAVNKTGPYVLPSDPEIWGEFRELLKGTDCKGELTTVERFAFYEEAKKDDVVLLIATGEQKIYANLLLTIGVRR